jgi:hypothetical protein
LQSVLRYIISYLFNLCQGEGWFFQGPGGGEGVEKKVSDDTRNTVNFMLAALSKNKRKLCRDLDVMPVMGRPVRPVHNISSFFF